ncbi:DUF4349 domain-containing protein [Nocardioides panacisoli]|uniref:DUF4349 domain-containing protein n=1 Tax=Nocardioides panacisoli TaxID=627624 RepID=A0ABP7IB87_9ACTN
MTSRVRVTVAATALLGIAGLTGLTGLTGCSSGSGGNDSGGSSGGSVADEGSAADSNAVRADAPADSVKAAYHAEDTAAEPALIKRGTIGLRSDDVAKARLDARHLVDIVGGTVDDEETTADDAGEVSSVRMVLRVPAAKYDEVTEQLKGIATLTDATSSSTDVRDRIIRTHVQIGVQHDAIARIRQLLARATNIGDIIRIESELTDRIASLDTLRRTAAYLADQTSMSTINLYIEKSPDHAAPAPEKRRTGFIGGLDRGWDAFTATVGWLAGAVGTVLPFAVALTVVGIPLGWLLRRRFRSGRTAKPVAG